MKLSKEEKEIVEKVSEETGTDYGINECYEIDPNNLVVALEEALSIIQHLEEMLLDLSRDIEDNYKPITKEEEIYG